MLVLFSVVCSVVVQCPCFYILSKNSLAVLEEFLDDKKVGMLIRVNCLKH